MMKLRNVAIFSMHKIIVFLENYIFYCEETHTATSFYCFSTFASLSFLLCLLFILFLQINQPENVSNEF
jgi:hypothetical protein